MTDTGHFEELATSAPGAVKLDTVDARDEAVRADARSEVALSLALLWRELRLGLCRVADSFASNERLFLLTRVVRGPATPLPAAVVQVLQAVLAGTCQNNIALDLAISASTVATRARVGLNRIGVEALPSHAPPLLMLAARCFNQTQLTTAGALSFIEHRGEALRVVGFGRPDVAPPSLPPGELAVVRGIFAGASYAAIARERGTSRRTVANQLASVFRRYGVSGRSELVLRLFELEANGARADRCAQRKK